MLKKAKQEACCNIQQNTNNGVGFYSDVPKLEQKNPNPFSTTTYIQFYLPSDLSAVINVRSLDGKMMNTYPIHGKGNGFIYVQAGSLTPGTYTYELVVDNKLIESKKMVLTGY